MEKLLETLSSIATLSPAFKASLNRLIVPLSLPKNHFLLEAPRIADHAFFISKGFAMSYTFLKGKPHVESFWNEGSIIMPAKSFMEQLPSREFIRLTVQSEVLCISYANTIQLLDQFPEANHIYRIVMNQYHEHCRERVWDLHHLSNAERYLKLRSAFPRIEQYVSQEYIASYLGMAPQSLSRMKRENDRS